MAGWVALVNWQAPEQIGAATAQNNYTTAKDICNPQRGLQPGILNEGTALRFTAWGIYSTTGTPTLALGLYYGGATSGTALATTAATTTGSGVSNQLWSLRAEGIVLATGNTNTSLQIATMGEVIGIASTASTPVFLGAGGGTSSTGNTVSSLDPTSLKQITVGAAWGTASASNTITCYQFLVEALNLI